MDDGWALLLTSIDVKDLQCENNVFSGNIPIARSNGDENTKLLKTKTEINDTKSNYQNESSSSQKYNISERPKPKKSISVGRCHAKKYFKLYMTEPQMLRNSLILEIKSAYKNWVACCKVFGTKIDNNSDDNDMESPSLLDAKDKESYTNYLVEKIKDYLTYYAELKTLRLIPIQGDVTSKYEVNMYSSETDDADSDGDNGFNIVDYNSNTNPDDLKDLVMNIDNLWNQYDLPTPYNPVFIQDDAAMHKFKSRLLQWVNCNDKLLSQESKQVILLFHNKLQKSLDDEINTTYLSNTKTLQTAGKNVYEKVDQIKFNDLSTALLQFIDSMKMEIKMLEMHKLDIQNGSVKYMRVENCTNYDKIRDDNEIVSSRFKKNTKEAITLNKRYIKNGIAYITNSNVITDVKSTIDAINELSWISKIANIIRDSIEKYNKVQWNMAMFLDSKSTIFARDKNRVMYVQQYLS